MSEPSPASKSSGRQPNNLAVRLGTVAVLGPLLLWLLFGGSSTAWAFFIAVSAGLSARELVSMTHPQDRVAQWILAGLTSLLAAGTYHFSSDPKLFLSALVGVLLFAALLSLFRLGELPTAALRTLGGMAAPFYVGILLMTIALLRRDLGDEGPRYVFLTLTIAWLGDTGGYTFGRLWGKTKLYEVVSPKKTREGLLGSVVFSTLASVGASLTYLPNLNSLHAAVLGVLGALLGQSGDLVESLIKRSTGVKDSGSLLPGHGGLLDRIDALLVVSPLVYLYALWFLI